jgi:pimeloyl-ACP methyl ester carboxylesterase
LLQSALGGLILRPWFDATALRLLVRWYFPLSRAWAAALAADGEPERFLAAISTGKRTRPLVPRLVASMKARRIALAAAEARWEEAFFGSGPATAAAESARLAAASAMMGLRALFTPLHLEQPIPAVSWAVESEQAVYGQHGLRRRHPQRAFSERVDLAAVEASRGFVTPRGVEGWVRLPSPVAAMGDLAWARVTSPDTRRLATAGRDQPPSLIFAHGIGMEPEWWSEPRDPLSALAHDGIRVIRPEAPWHGRRRLPGYYGGEPILARGPAGLLDFFHAHVVELGHLIAWARATRGGKVALGGVSLGALTAQLVAVAAREWPEEMRPDALLLVAPSSSLAAVAFEGSLSRALGIPGALAAAGWTEAATDHWRPLLEPGGQPAVDPQRIVVVLGEFDDVTLAHGGEALVDTWAVPPANVFRCPAGHFSTSLGLSRDAQPLARLFTVLKSSPAFPVGRNRV